MNSSELYKDFCGYPVMRYQKHWGFDPVLQEDVWEEHYEIVVREFIRVDLTELTRPRAVALVNMIENGLKEAGI